jgi:uncharacterized protein YndB with AHSA1/START domain
MSKGANGLALAGVEIIRIERERRIEASPEATFEAILEEIGPASELPDGTPMPMVVEPWPGGRWYRDLGDDAGHFWGHVQVIKPPALLELSGPMFMSFPAVNHVQYRLSADGRGTRLQLVHRAMGPIPDEAHGKLDQGWDSILGRIERNATRAASSGRKGGN